MTSSISELVEVLAPATYTLLGADAVVKHIELSRAYYGITYTEESELSEAQRAVLTYGTALSMTIAGIDKIRTEIQKAEAGPAKVEWVDKLRAFLELQKFLNKKLDSLLGLDDSLVPPIMQKLT